MIDRNGEPIDNDAHFGKFDSPMAMYVYSRLLNGDEGEQSASDGDGEWAERYGKRILWGDNHGFIYLNKYANEQEAIDAFALIDQELSADQVNDQAISHQHH